MTLARPPQVDNVTQMVLVKPVLGVRRYALRCKGAASRAPGVLGCALAHKRLMLLCDALRGWLLVAEDDTYPKLPLRHTSKLMNSLMEQAHDLADVIYWFAQAPVEYEPRTELASCVVGDEHYTLVRITRAYGMQFVMMRAAVRVYLIKTMTPQNVLPADVALGRAIIAGGFRAAALQIASRSWAQIVGHDSRSHGGSRLGNTAARSAE